MPEHAVPDNKNKVDEAQPSPYTVVKAKPGPGTIPQEMMLPYYISETPYVLTAPKEGVIPMTDPLTQAMPMQHWADQGLLPPPMYERGTRDQRISAYELTLDASNMYAGMLKGDAKTRYLKERLGALEHFTESLPAGENGASPRVPNRLIDNARPLIENLERQPAPADATATAVQNPEGARADGGRDWNTQLGVPQYRTQSDNLIPPEASCNMTSLAMALERMGYGRDDAMGAIDRNLKDRYLAELKAKAQKTHADPSTLPKSAKEVDLPEGYFEGRVKEYLKSVDDSAERPYQGVRGKDTNERAWDAISAEYKDKAQFEDTLDFLRYLTKAGGRTDLDTVTPKLLAAIEPDVEKRPTYRSVTPGRGGWTAARNELSGVLDEGGAAMLSFHHKGGNNTEASHIVSVQQMTKDGLIVDDPYGRVRDNYRLNETGDAYGERGQAGRSTTRKNLVDGSVRRDQPGTIDQDWWASAGQNLRTDESRGSSSTVSDATMSGAWRSLRFLEPAKPHKPADNQNAPAGNGHE